MPAAGNIFISALYLAIFSLPSEFCLGSSNGFFLGILKLLLELPLASFFFLDSENVLSMYIAYIINVINSIFYILSSFACDSFIF